MQLYISECEYYKQYCSVDKMENVMYTMYYLMGFNLKPHCHGSRPGFHPSSKNAFSECVLIKPDRSSHQMSVWYSA